MIEGEKFLGELRLGKQITSVRQLVAGSIILLLGCLFLIADRSLELLGGATGVASILAILILGLSLISLLELLAGSGERGGTSTLIRETLGSASGFLSGWALVASSVALSAGLALEGARHLLLLFPDTPVPTEWIAVSLIVVLILIQLFRTLPKRDWLFAAVVVLCIAFIVVLLSSLPQFSMARFNTSRVAEFTDVVQAAAWMTIGYAALESVLNLRRQTQQPLRLIPIGLLVSLVAMGLIFGLPQMIAAGLPPLEIDAVGIEFTLQFTEASVFPSWFVDGLLLVLFWLAANMALMSGARHLHRLSRQGALPETLRRLYPRFRIPPLLLFTLFLLCLPLILWGNLPWLVDLAAGMYLFTLILLNITAIVSRQREPDRRRLITVPLSPLVPGIAIAVSIALIFALSLAGIVSGVIWIGIGLAFFLVYGRTHLIDAQAGISVFGPDPDSSGEDDVYRILLPLGMGRERHFMLELGTALAKQANGKLIPMQVVTIADPLAIEEGRRIAQERNTLFQWSTREASKSGVLTYPITRLARSVSEGIVDTAREEDCDLILMSWSIGLEGGEARMGKVLDPVVRTAPCDLAVVAVHPSYWTDSESMKKDEGSGEADPHSDADGKTYKLKKIVVPTAGGPHAPLATQLAVMLAREYNATATALYVARPDASAEDLKLAEARIQSTLDAMLQAESEMFRGGDGETLEPIPVGSEVISALSVVEGIAQAGEESDLVFVGASEESIIDQVLFGSVPEQVAKLCPTPVIMVKRFQGLPRFWIQRAWNWASSAVPTLSNSQQVDIYKQIRRGARPDVDFFVMIGLSAIIASFGLLQDSVAVIIGAMLVAPLFTPMMAISLSLVLGDLRLFRLAIEATLKGAALAVGMAVLLGALIPLENLSPEILARTQPNLLDLGVALASGAAGAYAVARKDVAASLPGVAIAAALLPPLCVLGIGLAFGEIDVAAGGALLFLTNLIAIAFSGGLVFLLLGFRPATHVTREARLRWGLAAMVTLLVLISIPLATVFVQAVRGSYLRQVINKTLQASYGHDPVFGVVDTFVDDGKDYIQIVATIRSSDPITREDALDIQAELIQELNRPVYLRLVAVPLTEIDLPPP